MIFAQNQPKPTKRNKGYIAKALGNLGQKWRVMGRRFILQEVLKTITSKAGRPTAFILVFAMIGSYFIFRSFAAAPITITMPAGATACSTRFSSEDVWPGYFYEQ